MDDGSEKFIPRGIRNNNPGNIKKNSIDWNGLVPEDEQTDNTFFIFESPKYGIRALSKILITYRGYGLTNIYSIVNRYAPPIENNTESYKEFVSAKAGIGILQNLENTIEDYLPIVKAIIEMENGVQPYDEETILEGMYLAWNQ
jgi:hypothetical protein